MSSEIELLIRAATGEQVTRSEILRVLHRSSTRDKSESARIESHARVKLRNAALLAAAELLGADKPDPWKLAGRMQDAVTRFQTRLWPLLKAGASIEISSPLDAALHRAFLTRKKVPATQNGLYDFLMENIC